MTHTYLDFAIVSPGQDAYPVYLSYRPMQGDFLVSHRRRIILIARRLKDNPQPVILAAAGAAADSYPRL